MESKGINLKMMLTWEHYPRHIGKSLYNSVFIDYHYNRKLEYEIGDLFLSGMEEKRKNLKTESSIWSIRDIEIYQKKEN